jgi:DNA-binding NarL/FixJ family response regulator
MSLTISNVPSTATPATPSAAAFPQPVQQPVQPTGAASADSVTLTAAQQVYNLYNEGQSVSQIATGLSLTVSVVNNYLGITASGG